MGLYEMLRGVNKEQALAPEAGMASLLKQGLLNAYNAVTNPRQAVSNAVDSSLPPMYKGNNLREMIANNTTPESLSKMIEFAINNNPGAVGSMAVKASKTAPFWKEMQDVAYQPGHVKENIFSDLNNVLMNHPDDLAFNPDTGRIVGSVARDGVFAIKGDKGGYSLKKQDFIDWLYSDKPFDPKVYGDNIKADSEWVGRIDRLRKALGGK